MSSSRIPKQDEERGDLHPGTRFVFTSLGRQPTISDEVIKRMREQLPSKRRKEHTKKL